MNTPKNQNLIADARIHSARSDSTQTKFKRSLNLNNCVKHYFFGKDCIIDRELSKREELNCSLTKQGFRHSNMLFVNQIHGAEIVVVDAKEKIHGDQNLPKADGLVTNLPNIAIGIITADCAPILLFDEEKNVIAAIHAGWRGAKLGVISAAVEKMKKLGAQKISAIIGPMIQQKSYEVSQEFFDDFTSENQANKKFFIDGLKADKHLFDLPSYVEEKLCEAGISEIKNERIDTYENEQNLFSFRRSTHRGEKDCGRNVSVIMIDK
jgi:YfiH family protein